ncbi:MAG: uncharacterized protein QG597_840 [Actinomycetota bacterium]|nr:uncharacterized protein [Actinomycetota bacterium]
MNWDPAVANLTSVPVLAFVLGLVAVGLRSDLRLPDAIYQVLSMYLLLAIGLKGGVALRESQVSEVVAPVLLTVVLGVLIPLACFALLRLLTSLSRVDRGAMAAHYGSTSLVTFTAALVFLDSENIDYDGYVATLLTVMEVPGIVVGLLLAGAGAAGAAGASAALATRWSETVREVLLGRSIVLLVGGLLIGVVTGPVGYAKVEPLFGSLFIGALALFLLEMGVLTGRRLGDVRRAGWGLVAFALIFPFVAATAGIVAGVVIGMSVGTATVLGVLCASASYIAAPAAVRLALPEANPGITLAASLGITFPMNLVIGIPLYLALAEFVEQMVP